MSLFPVIVIFGLSFQTIFFDLLMSLVKFWQILRVMFPTGIYDILILRFIAACFG